MGLIKIKKGLDIPVFGKPEQKIYPASNPRTVALIGYDYIGLRPKLAVKVGDLVKLGQLLFTDKKMPSVRYTSPGTGKVISINRGPKRVFESIVIELNGQDEITFDSFSETQLKNIGREKVKTLLIDSGLWTSIRARPYSKVADPGILPHSLFITAMDTNPHAPIIDVIIKGNERDYVNGAIVLSKLTDGKTFICKWPGAPIPDADIKSLEVKEFAGPHPSGNVGTHIHFIDPVHRNKIVWYINVQDVIAIGRFFVSGKIPVERVISLAGPSVKRPRLLRARIGACIEEITEGELLEKDNRLISGSVLSGRISTGAVKYIGRYHQQISVLEEGRDRKFLGWMSPGFNVYSSRNIVISRLFPRKKFDFTTAIHGGKRAIMPIGNYEKVMPLDILPTFLLRSLMVDDIEEAEKLGCLELDEEDLALCGFVSPSKIDYGPVLRRNLTKIEKEG